MVQYILICFFCCQLFFLAVVGDTLANKAKTIDFAKGYQLEITKKGTLYTFLLPKDVYQTVRSPSFTDLAIFNSAGEPVAYDLNSTKTDSEAKMVVKDIPLFPVFSEGSNNSDLSMRVERNPNGAIVTVVSTNSIKGDNGNIDSSPSTSISSYLLDLNDMEESISQLDFFWDVTGEEKSELYRIDILESKDLQNWALLHSNLVLADIAYKGNRIEKRSVILKRRSANYLKIVPVGAEESRGPLLLTRVAGTIRTASPQMSRHWLKLEESEAEDLVVNKNKIFLSTSAAPVDSAQLTLIGENRFASLQLWSRADNDERWKLRCEQSFYRLQFEKTILRNDVCTFSPTSDSHWRISSQEGISGPLLKKGQIKLEVSWPPIEVSFLAQGRGPYILAYGSAKIAENGIAVQRERIKDSLPKQSISQMAGTALVGNSITLGGVQMLEPISNSEAWRKWLLWAVLLVGVGVLALMFRKLLREMKQV